jgi:outer membrane receptor protein involved in Fe transport
VLQVWSRRALGLVLVLLAFSVTARALQAQTGKIAGVVTDQGTGQPVEGVQVFLPGTGYGAITNASGRFFIISVTPGTYTVAARRVGYQQQNVTNVQVQTDITREVNFRLSSAAAQVATVEIRAQQTPLFAPGQTGSQTPITAQQIQALPVTNIEQALSLQQGFVQVPSSPDIISLTDSRRNTQNPISIRGGRSGETLMLIDGIPVQNFIFGGPALSLSPEAVNQIDLLKGGFGPEYGNALSGIINITTKEGGTDLAGALRYQTSRFGGFLGQEQDDLRNYGLVEGFLSGPIPGTSQKLRFMLSGRQERQADQVFQYDNDIFVPDQMPSTQGFPAGGPNFRDVFPGWRAFGYNNTRQAFGKLAYYVTPQAKLTFTLLDNQRQRMPFSPEYLSTYGSVLNSPAARSAADSVVFIQNLTGYRLAPLDFEKVVQNSIRSQQRLYAGRWDHTIGRTNYKIAGGVFQTRRTTCNYYQGVCLGSSFTDPNFTDDQFIGPLAGSCAISPNCGTDQFYGGERLNTFVLRGDGQSQVTDHHNLAAGALFQRYDLKVALDQNVGTNIVNVYTQRYANKPTDLALYVQDNIEYDFVTVRLGARFDYGKVPGTFFANPLDPTNGTTAQDVCANPTDPRWANGVNFKNYDAATEKVTTEKVTPNPDWATTGCSPADLQTAKEIAAYDDFKAAKARKQFSPRIGVSFPLSEQSAVFFNFGRYSQNPLLNNLLTNTGVGTPREGTIVGPVISVPGEGNPGVVGNPNLAIERATTYEMGYNSEFAQNYALGVTLYNKNQSGLTGLRQGGQVPSRGGYTQVFDPGVTYGEDNTPSYAVLVNQDYQTVRGLEVQLRRRIQNYWGFDINYSYSRARTNASEPEREFERTGVGTGQAAQGDPQNLYEVPSDIDQPQSFNAAVTGQVQDEAPKFPGGFLLTNVTATVAVQISSGFPYTPTAAYNTVGLLSQTRNSGRGPATSLVSLQFQKGLRFTNLRTDLFVQVHNLFDRKNCVSVFSTTGTCDAGAPDQNRARQGNTIRPDVATTTYSNRADYYGERRSVYGGIRVSF